MLKRLSVTLLVSFFSLTALAQDSGDIAGAGTWWVNLGAGASTTLGYDPKSDDDFADDAASGSSPMLAASFNYALFDHQFIELRATQSTQFNASLANCLSSVCFGSSQEKLDSITDGGILYGLMGKTKYVTATGSIGLAYTDVTYDRQTIIEVNGVEDTETTHTHVGTVGVPFEVTVFFTPVRYFGIGVMLMGNANAEASYIGGLIGLQFGKLR